MSIEWNTKYARRLEWMNTSAIREILKVAQSPDTISMAGGWPEADLFPVEQLAEIASHVLQTMPRESLQYGVTDGYIGLRQVLAEYMTSLGVISKTENIVITSGSQQGLSLLACIMINEGDTVLVENPTFLGALQSFNTYGAQYAPVPVDDDGVCVDQLERAIQETKPKFMYLLPNFQNPTGVTMSLERRQRVVEIAERYGVPIVEDDPYGQLRFEGEALPTLFELDAQRHPENVDGNHRVGNVIYLNTFSKLLAPGLRTAWVVCPPELAQPLVMAKQGADLHTNALSQTIAYEFLRRGWMPAQVQRIRDTYLERRNAMHEAIADFFPKSIRCTNPQGGLFLWVELPEGANAVELLKEAAKQNVAFVPGSPFFVDGTGQNTLRLCFASCPPPVIREGIRRLGSVMDNYL